MMINCGSALQINEGYTAAREMLYSLTPKGMCEVQKQGAEVPCADRV
jgi:hypothetical protein